MQKGIPVRYLEGVGWVAETEMYLNAWQLQRTAEIAHKQLWGRMLDMPMGSNKDLMKQRLAELKLGKLQQVPVKKDGGIPLFQSTERTSDTIYSFPK
jgi:hypothetical protein